MEEDAQRAFTDELVVGIKAIRGTYFTEELDRGGLEKLKKTMNQKGSKMVVK